MELHGENKFKIRSYQNAYMTLRKLDTPLDDMSADEIGQLKGVGKAIVGKIEELKEKGAMDTLNRYLEQTPEGVQEMLYIKGFGPKKIQTIWKDLGIESVGELLYACNENRLIELKGFGQKTQEDLRQKLEYYLRSRHKFHYAKLEMEAQELEKALKGRFPDQQVSLCGGLRRRSPVVERIELLLTETTDLQAQLQGLGLQQLQAVADGFQAVTSEDAPVHLYICAAQRFGSELFLRSAAEDFLAAFRQKYPEVLQQEWTDEAALFARAGLPFIVPELREQAWALELAAAETLPTLITEDDIQGVVHAHSTYSDGLHSLRQMAEAARDKGYTYLAISDHSKSAFYANGLQVDRLQQQFEEIDQLNAELAPFRIFKGIESDILNDGSLDYDDSTLQSFDFIIASVHSNLRMDEEKATQRLIKAIEHPATTILGHPTGRLLLSRKGYPIDHKRVIDACAEHGVSIELNANPYRLDLDWTWVPYALEKGIRISINPDAHSQQGIDDIHFGVLAARKGGLTADRCLNALSVEEFAKAIT